MRKIFLVFAAVFLFGTSALAQKLTTGDYYTDYGTLGVKASFLNKKEFDFALTIETKQGCTGELEGTAKLVRGRNVYAWEEKLSEDKNYGANAKYRLEFTVVGNKITVKESSPGANRAVTLYRGQNCTFNGIYKK